MRRGLILVFALISLVPRAARAGYRPFTFSYDAYAMNKGELEVEQWATLSFQKDQDSSFKRLDFREEVEYGLTNNFRLSAYVPNWSWEESKTRSGVQFDSAGVEGIWILTNPVTDAVGVALYGEVNVGDRDLDAESKLILHKDIEKWTLIYNLVAETEWEDLISKSENSPDGVLGHTFGVAYSLAPAWRAGGELTVESVFKEWDKYEHTTVYAGPVLSYQGKEIPGTKAAWWATITPMVQLTDIDEEPDFQIRLIVGITF